ncbi:MAG: cation:proton antiporter [archaeon]
MVIDPVGATLQTTLLFELGTILILAAIFAYIAKALKQPLIPAYVITGIIIGPMVLGLIQDIELIKSLSELGIIFLLFVVGVEIDLNKLKKVGWAVGIGGIFQVLMTFLCGFFVGSLLGFDTINSIYAGLIVAFSSTMIVIKLLSDEEEINTLHGRLILGILFVQDVLVILALALLGLGENASALAFLIIFIKGLLLGSVAYITNKFAIKPFFKFAAKSAELLFLLSIAICFLFALFAHTLGFSLAIGAFIGGVILANLPYNLNIIGRISPLKDFFSTIFFATLGMQLVLVNFNNLILPLILFLIIILILKPIFIMLILSLFGYGKRNAFVSAVSLAQISEFALILVMMVQKTMSPELFSLTIILAVITITMTSYIIKYELFFYNIISKPLNSLDKISVKKRMFGYKEHEERQIIMFGYHRMGTTILSLLKNLKTKILIVDFNPEIIEKLTSKKIPCMYGDMANLEILKRIKVKKAKIILSTVPQEKDNIIMLNYVKEVNPKCKIFVSANHLHEALDLYEAGADYVIMPHLLSGERTGNLVNKFVKGTVDLKTTRNKHLKQLLEINSSLI